MKMRKIIGLAAALLSATAGADNLLNKGAIISGSSFYGEPDYVTVKTRNYFTAIADGDHSTCWSPMEKRGPHWLEMRWRCPVKINAVVWEAMNLDEAQLSYWQDNRFQPLKKLKGREGKCTFPTVTTEKLRLELTKYSGLPSIFELAVMGPDQVLPPAALPTAFLKAKEFRVLKVRIAPREARPGDRVEIAMRVKAESDIAQKCLFLAELREETVSPELRWRFGDLELASRIMEPTAAWKAGEIRELNCSFQLPEYSPSGSIPVMLTAITADGKQQVAVYMPEDRPVVNIRRPESASRPPDSMKAALGEHNGQRGFVLNSQFRLPFFMRYMCSLDFERIYSAGDMGIDLYQFMAYPCSLRPQSEWRQFFERLDQQIMATLRVHPGCFFQIGMDLRPSSNWLAENPDELMQFQTGKTIQPAKAAKDRQVSYGSEKYLRDCYAFIDALIAFLKTKPYYHRIFSYYPWTNTKNDAFIGGIQSNSMVERAKAMKQIGDFHPGVIKLFRKWLKEKYRGNVEALRQAWHDPRVTFESAYPDPYKLLAEDYPHGVFRDAVASRAAIDYWNFFPTLLGNFKRKIAAHIKKQTGQKLVLLHYGPVLQCLVMDQPTGTHCQSPNLDFPRLLKDDNIDMYVQSQPYDKRWADNPVVYFHPIESLNLNNRMFVADYDIRSIASGTLDYRHRSQYETETVIYRDLSWLMMKNSGAWLADMSNVNVLYSTLWNQWVEYRQPWFATPEVTGPVRRLKEVFRKAMTVTKRNVSEIVVVLSLKTLPYEDALNSACLYRNLVAKFMMAELTRLGAPYDIILSDDLTNPKLKKDYKLYIFLNTFFLSVEERAAIEQLKRDGKTLFWFYAPGYLNGKTGFDLAAMNSLTGISAAVKTGKCELLQMKTVNSGSPLTAGMKNASFVAETWPGCLHLHPEKIQPVFYIDDPEAEVLAKYPDGRTAWAARNFGAWKSVYCAVPLLNLQAVRNLARYAGVHLYCDEDIVMNADNRLLMFSNGYKKKCTITVKLPRTATVKDAMTGKVVSTDKKSFPLTLNTPETRILSLEP